jgi:hypothetical protein
MDAEANTGAPLGRPATRPWSKAGGEWTHELVGYALDRYHRRHLRTPTKRELTAGIDDLPSIATIKRLYGNTSTMLRQHGYRPRPSGAQLGSEMYRRLERDRQGRFLPRQSQRQRPAA